MSRARLGSFAMPWQAVGSPPLGTDQPKHGYGVAVRIEQISNGVFHENAGSRSNACNEPG